MPGPRIRSRPTSTRPAAPARTRPRRSSSATAATGRRSFRREAALPDRWKRAAAEAAVALVEDGMTLGLGTGSTAAAALEALALRLRAGLSIAGGVPTSDRT